MLATLQPVDAGTWERVPGYSSDDSDSDTEEAELLSVADERLQEVVSLLGCNWLERPRVAFVPAPVSHAGVALPPAFRCESMWRRWGGQNPTPTFRLESHTPPIVKDTFLASGLLPTRDRDFAISWSGPYIKDSTYEGLSEFQKVNHFPSSSELTRKDRLWSNFHEMSKAFGSDTFDFVPRTYVLPKELDDFLSAFEQQPENLWIVKPHASSRGRGIFVLQDLEELPLQEICVVSRYVDRPLLIQGLKFDLRVYVLVTSYEPLRAYVYREGLTRFASKPFSTKKEHLGDAYRHLTNYSINKSAKNFQENQEIRSDNVGHKWSLSALNRHLKCTGVDVKLMWARIMDLLMKSLLSVKPGITSKTQRLMGEQQNCFEIYGFDVLVDADLKPWLLEVNLSPSLQADSPLDWQIKGSLLADAFNVVGVVSVDQHTATLARARTQRDQLYRAARAARSASAGPSRGARLGTASGTRSSSMSSRSSQADAPSSQALPPLSPEQLPALGSLGVEQLKALALGLQELARPQNFVRLFPTKATAQRYEPMLRSLCLGQTMATQLLASMVRGSHPSSSSSSRGPPQRPTAVSTAAPSRAGRGPQASTPKAALPREAREALSTPEVLRLVLLEYLARICRACQALDSTAWLLISQGSAFSRLFAFQRRLQQLAGADFGETLRGAEGAEGLLSACRAGVARLEGALWEEAGLESVPVEPADFGRPGWLAARLPAALSESQAVRQLLQALPGLKAQHLESALLSPESVFRSLFEPVVPDGRLPLSELLAAADPRRPCPRPQSGNSPWEAGASQLPYTTVPLDSFQSQLLRSPVRVPSLPELQRRPMATLGPLQHSRSATNLESVTTRIEEPRSVCPVTKPLPLAARPPPLPRKVMHPSIYHRDIEL